MTEQQKKEVKVAKTEKPDLVVSVSATKAKETTKEVLVEIVTKESFKIMYGDRWYYFTKGTPVKVSKELKEYLNRQGALAVL